MTHLETGRAPIDELDRTLRLNACNCCRRVLWHHVTAVKQAHSHYCEFNLSRSWTNREPVARTILSVLRVAFYLTTYSAKSIKGQRNEVYHLIAVFKAGEGHFCHGVLFVRRLLRGEERGVGS
jgi:hypothetical protein